MIILVVFRYELKQLAKNSIIWALCAGALIFLMLPVYIGFTTEGGGAMAGMMENNAVFDVLGVDTDFVMNPIGMFSFLNSFAMIAVAIHGMGAAFGSHTKEYANKSAEFLLTKPYSRGRVFWSKLAACAVDCLAVGAAFTLGAALALASLKGANIDWRAFVLIAKTMLLVEWMFMIYGALAGAFFPNARTPVLISACVMLASFCLNTMAKKIGAPILYYFTPFAFFNPRRIAETGFYDIDMAVWYIVSGAALSLAAFAKYVKRDVSYAG